MEEGKVRINSAGLDEIMTLPGIGEQKRKVLSNFVIQMVNFNPLMICYKSLASEKKRLSGLEKW